MRTLYEEYLDNGVTYFNHVQEEKFLQIVGIKI